MAEEAKTEATEKPAPSWYYGPDGAAEIFTDPADVPKGWADHPAKVGGKKPAKETPE